MTATAILSSSGIYAIRNTVNDKFYVGSAVKFSRRKAQHFHLLRNGKHHSIRLQNAWNRYGESNFVFEILECIENILTLVDIEQRWIDDLDSFGLNGYNATPIAGSRLGSKASEETKKKLSIARKGISPVFSNPVQRGKNISAARKGYKMPDSTKALLSAINIGKKLSQETIAKISATRLKFRQAPGYVHPSTGKKMPRDSVERTRDANTGRKRTDEQRARMSAAQTGKKKCPLSAETKAKLSAALKGRSHKPMSDETKEKLRQLAKIQFSNPDARNNLHPVIIGNVRFSSHQKASEHFGCTPDNIRHWLRSGRAVKAPD